MLLGITNVTLSQTPGSLDTFTQHPTSCHTKKGVHTTIIPSKNNSLVEQSHRRSFYSTHLWCFQEWGLGTKSLEPNPLPTIPIISPVCTPSPALSIPFSSCFAMCLFLHAPSTLHAHYRMNKAQREGRFVYWKKKKKLAAISRWTENCGMVYDNVSVYFSNVT